MEGSAGLGLNSPTLSRRTGLGTGTGVRLKISSACLKGRGTESPLCAMGVRTCTRKHTRACISACRPRGKHKNRAATYISRSRRGPLWQKNAGDKIAQPLQPFAKGWRGSLIVYVRIAVQAIYTCGRARASVSPYIYNDRKPRHRHHDARQQ